MTTSSNPPTNLSKQLNQDFHWECQPDADQMFRQLVDDFCEDCDFASELRNRMLAETGTRFFDWVDHIAVGRDTQLNDRPFASQLKEFGYELDFEDEHGSWYVHHGGLFVPICVQPAEIRRLAIAVEAVDDFCVSHGLTGTPLEGQRVRLSGGPSSVRKVDASFGSVSGTDTLVGRFRNQTVICVLQRSTISKPSNCESVITQMTIPVLSWRPL